MFTITLVNILFFFSICIFASSCPPEEKKKLEMLSRNFDYWIDVTANIHWIKRMYLEAWVVNFLCTPLVDVSKSSTYDFLLSLSSISIRLLDMINDGKIHSNLKKPTRQICGSFTLTGGSLTLPT